MKSTATIRVRKFDSGFWEDVETFSRYQKRVSEESYVLGLFKETTVKDVFTETKEAFCIRIRNEAMKFSSLHTIGSPMSKYQDIEIVCHEDFYPGGDLVSRETRAIPYWRNGYWL